MNEQQGILRPEGSEQESRTGFTEHMKVVAAVFGRSTSDTVLFAGILIDQKPLQLETVEIVAQRIGLSVSPYNGRLSKIRESHLPAIAVLKDGSTLALIREDYAGNIIGAADIQEAGGVIPRKKIRKLKPKFVASFAVGDDFDNERAAIGEGQKNVNQHWLRSTLRRVWRAYIYVALAALFINTIAIATPIFVMNVYDRILPNEAITSLWVLGGGITMALVFDFLLKTSRSAIIDYSGRTADLRIGNLLFEKVLNLRLDSRPGATGEFVARVGQYEFVREFFTSNTIATIIDTLFVFLFVLVIWLIAGWIAVIPVIAFALAVVAGLITQHRIGRLVNRAANEASLRNAHLVESVSTIETVKAIRAEAPLLEKWQLLNKQASATSERIKQESARALSFTQLIQQCVTVAIVIAGAYAYSAGSLTTGGIIASVMLAGRAVAPLGQIALTLTRMRQAILSLRIINQIMQLPDDRPDRSGFINREVESGQIDFNNVSFAYSEDDLPALGNINIKIAPGERVGLIGKIGSGKTTFGKLLSAFYYPQSGRLLIDGIDIRQYHPAEIRRSVSYTGQSIDLFSGTLKENLQLAKPDASDQEIIAAAKLTGVDDIASRDPRGYDMPVGERGNKLSGGQRQAVANARLLLTKPKIVFLDEPSGAMDLTSERQLITTLSNTFGTDTTLLVSTHRMSLLELVDRLIVLDNGKLVADGPKQEVLDQLAKRAEAYKSASS